MTTDTKQDSPKASKVKMIDATPTWGEFGNILAGLVQRGELTAITKIMPDIGSALARAEAFSRIYDKLPADLKEEANAIYSAETKKQGL